MTNNEETIKNNIFLNPSLAQYDAVLKLEAQKTDKIKEFKERIAPFENISSLAEAKELANKVLPTANEVNRFYVGDAKCVVINREDMLRISIDTADEFLCYDFT